MYKLRKKTLTISFLLFTSFLIVSINSHALYSQDLKKNNEYTWTIEKLEKVGTYSTPYLTINNVNLKQGDILKLRLLNDTDDVANDSVSNLWNRGNVWFNLFINDEFITNDTDIALFDLDWMGISRIHIDWANQFDFYWVQPVEFSNSTGTFDFFEVTNSIFENLKQNQKVVEEFHGFYSEVNWNLKQISKISDQTWTVVVSWTYDENTEDRTSSDWSITNLKETITTEFRFNRQTGLLVYLAYNYELKQNIKSEGVETDELESLDLLITNNELPTKASFNMYYLIYSLLLVTSISITTKRLKR